MDAKYFCTTVMADLVALKARAYDIVSAVEKSSNKGKLAPKLQSLNALITDLGSKIDKLNTSALLSEPDDAVLVFLIQERCCSHACGQNVGLSDFARFSFPLSAKNVWRACGAVRRGETKPTVGD